MKKSIVTALLTITMIVSISMTTFVSCVKSSSNIFFEKNNNEDSLIEYPEDCDFKDSKESKNFDYSYKVDINSDKSNKQYISINFIIEITPKIQDKFENLLATAYIDDSVFESMEVKSCNSFGVSKEEPLTIDTTNPDMKGFSIARGTWIYKDTKLDELTRNLEKGIKVKVVWKNGEEYINIKKVNIEIKQ